MLGRLTHRIGIGGDIRQPAVHFPVSRNELPQCVILPSVGNYLNRPWAARYAASGRPVGTKQAYPFRAIAQSRPPSYRGGGLG